MLKREFRVIPQSQSSLSSKTENTFLVETEHNSDVDESIREEIEKRSAQSIANKSYVFPRVSCLPYKLPMISLRATAKKAFTINKPSSYIGSGLLTSEKLNKSYGRTLNLSYKSKTPVPNKLLARLLPMSRTPAKRSQPNTNRKNVFKLS